MLCSLLMAAAVAVKIHPQISRSSSVDNQAPPLLTVPSGACSSPRAPLRSGDAARMARRRVNLRAAVKLPHS